MTSLPPVEPAHLARLLAIEAVLRGREEIRLRAILQEQAPEQIRALLVRLSEVSLPDAVRLVRREVLDECEDGCVESDDGFHCDYCGGAL